MTEGLLTEEDDCDGDKDHEDMMVAQKRYQPLDTHREPHVRHRRRNVSLPALWLAVLLLPQSPRDREMVLVRNATACLFFFPFSSLRVNVFGSQGMYVFRVERTLYLHTSERALHFQTGAIRNVTVNRFCNGKMSEEPPF